jgi:DNA-binding CsgD family transcriptional regulator/tetratricopeptide (TPR) repeat protein/type II secretory pathway predicted ATPase ExeA
VSTAPAIRLAQTSDLLERSPQLAALEEKLDAVRSTSRGRLMLVAGEAGAGKTALARRFTDERRGSARILWGACDALFTPRALGPLLDVAEDTGGDLARVTAEGAGPHEVATALLRELVRSAPTVLVLEDLHWADEATLDVLRLLARKVESAPALVLATYRDDDLDLRRGLRVVLGELATARGIDRCEIPPLSPDAVAQLAEPHGIDADELYRRTAGNPFFLSEVLASGDREIPPTVRDAVLARAARLSATARTLLDAVAVSQPQAELWLLEALAGEELDCLDECLGSGMLTGTAEGVAFRHELARMAVEETLAPHRRAALHRGALAALAAPPAGAPDPARLAHHAEAAGDAGAVLRFAPAAAARAESVGAHREAAAQYARALRFGADLAPERQVDLLERRSRSAFRADDCGEAIEALEEALEGHRALGDRLKQGDRLRRLSGVLFCPGDRSADAASSGSEAVTVLEGLAPGRELGLAYANMATLCMNREDADGTVAWSARALELAERLDDVEIRVQTLNTTGTMELLVGTPAGREKLERSIALAREAGLQEDVARGFSHLAWTGLRTRSYAVADDALAAGLDYCAEPHFDLWRLYLLGFAARSALDQGRWTEAAERASVVLGDSRSSSIPRILAGVVLGLVRARRGDPGASAALEDALALAEVSEELQRIEAVAAARAEVAWLRGDREGVAQATEVAFDLAKRLRAGWVIGQLASWRRRAGISEETPADVAEPYALQLGGDWKGAAALWTAIGCPYEAALARADGDGDALRRALAELQELGAHPAAAIVARRLRARGARGLPRGPRRVTRDNPANLTPRQVEVLVLLAEGLRNRQIAERLFLSPKTVDHHVGAILRKLGVHTRGEAGAAARRLGVGVEDR